MGEGPGLGGWDSEGGNHGGLETLRKGRRERKIEMKREMGWNGGPETDRYGRERGLILVDLPVPPDREREGGANRAEGLGGKEGEERIRRKAGREVRDEAGRLLGVSAPTGLTFYRRSKNIVTYCDLLRSIYKNNDLLYKMVFYCKILQFEAYQRKNLAQ